MRYAAYILASLGTALFAAPTLADPAIGFGFSFTLSRSGQVETGLGLRLFAENGDEKLTPSLGVDYVMTTGNIRPTIGIAKLGTEGFTGADISLTGAPTLSISGSALSTRASRVHLRNP